ncbi:S8 family serine peptidase [Amycolatopsis palatopharyngis]|uniref:S8 family serine peptidase n=1 Tax=Amycolatopsis palatopharyngis TaxID=187982 RepID=UPI0013BEA9E0|nr:S8 family serine peptidase [Amycolatopsis palatopharyngis]
MATLAFAEPASGQVDIETNTVLRSNDALSTVEGPVLQPWLSTKLAGSAPGELVRVFVHAEDAAHLVDAKEAILGNGLEPVTTWAAIGVAVGVGTPEQIRAVAATDGVQYVEGDRRLEYTLDTSHEATRGDVARKTFTDGAGREIDGSGTSIAVVDSGIDGTHPMFQWPEGAAKEGSKVARNLENVCALGDFDGQFNANCLVDEPTNNTDTNSAGGHGTHVAGIAAGVDVTLPDGREMHGAAPGAELVGISTGNALVLFGTNVGLNWILQNHENPCAGNLPTRPQVCEPIVSTNHSYGPIGGGEYDPNGATAKFQDALVAEGIVTSWAAGNDGGDGTSDMVSPYAKSPNPGVLGVASYDDANTGTRNGAVSSFSSRGENGDPTSYPDISAPGSNITSACRPTLPICQSAEYLDYGTISGTSMATPHLAGIVAQLRQADAAITPAEIEDVLEDNAHKFTDGANYESDPRNSDDTTSFDKGHGLVDVAEAVAKVLGVSAPPADDDTTCTSSGPQLTDAQGDALGFDPETTETNEPSLDIRTGFVTANVDNDVTFHLTVDDLRSTPPSGAEGEYFEYFFDYGGSTYSIELSRSAVRGETVELRDSQENFIATLEGSFDVEADEITATVPAGALVPAVGNGATFAGFEIIAWRLEGALLLRADDAIGLCSYEVGGGDEDAAENNPPIATADISPDEPRAKQPVMFDGSDSTDPDGDALTYRWDFGDGNQANGVTVQHVYAKPGRYVVTLTVRDGNGGVDRDRSILKIRGQGNE